MAAELFPPFEELIGRRDAAFLLDFDGTLVDLVADPRAVQVPALLVRHMQTIAARADMAFAIVTGRSLQVLDEFLQGVTTAAVGSHGAEWRSGPMAPVQPLATSMPPDLRAAVREAGERNGCLVEDKAYTLSLHLPLEDMERDLAPELLAALGPAAGLCVIRKIGRTYEILQKSVNKGSGIRHLMSHPVFAGRRPIYIGDDTHSDESLEAVRALGGMLLPVASSLDGNMHGQGDFLVEDARRIVAALAEE